ncbi:MAG: hypothetical protein HQM11_07725 [SAR324 cluster bacterium]|nr:hypothetical protein [SAR324 cluster bacterium]
MASMSVLKIVNPRNPDEFSVINERDFIPGKHILWDDRLKARELEVARREKEIAEKEREQQNKKKKKDESEQILPSSQSNSEQ